VPTDDKWFDEFARAWGEANGVQVVVDHINIGDLVTTTTSEMSAGSGHDIIELGPEAHNSCPMCWIWQTSTSRRQNSLAMCSG
jgi:multiple sugar transport system substrate-binding protein